MISRGGWASVKGFAGGGEKRVVLEERKDFVGTTRGSSISLCYGAPHGIQVPSWVKATWMVVK